MTNYPIAYLRGVCLAVTLCLNAPALAATLPAAQSAAASAPRKEARFTPDSTYVNRMVSEDAVWRGEVLVEGSVTIAPQATLTVEPGTVVRFRQKGAQVPLLVVQGRIVATGSKESPITFTSTYAAPAAGDWQGVMLLGSEKKNVLENCRIDGAQTGLDAVFSNVTLKSVRAERSGTGMRFQDALVVMENGGAGDCETGLSFIESEATLRNVSAVGNRTAVSALRSSVYLEGGNLAMNRSGYFADGGRVKILGGTVVDNSRGITLNECQGSVTGVKIARNSDYGMSLTTSRIRVSGNEITGNGQSGLLVFDAASVAWGNAIHGNTGYDLYNAGAQEYRAPGNWWGGAAPKVYENAGLGKVLFAPQLAAQPQRGNGQLTIDN